MPVTRNGKGRKMTCTLECETCEETSRPYTPTSAAAPELTACEQAEEDGWSFTIGFWAMLAGHRVWCPSCTSKATSNSV